MASSSEGGGGNLSFQDTGLCHSNRKSTTHKCGEISQKYTHKSGRISQNLEEFLKRIPINLGNFLRIIPINPEMPKQLTNKPINEFVQKTIPINPENAKNC